MAKRCSGRRQKGCLFLAYGSRRRPARPLLLGCWPAPLNSRTLPLACGPPGILDPPILSCQFSFDFLASFLTLARWAEDKGPQSSPDLRGYITPTQPSSHVPWLCRPLP